MTDPAVLSPFERTVGAIGGTVDAGALPDTTRTPREAFEDVIRNALQRGPCVVSFSGGRDSSVVLAVAAHVARREGLPLPVPVSLTFPDCESADEREWQELVVRHLDLPDWQRPVFVDEMDCIGPIAAPVLRRHGLLWPFNAFFHVPVLEAAAGGSVLTGVGGDEIFSDDWSWQRENRLVRGRARPRPMDPVRLLVSVLPAAVRRRFLALRHPVPDSGRPTWLRPAAWDEVQRIRQDALGRESLSFARSVRSVIWPSRARMIGAASLGVLAADHDVDCVSPLGHPEFLAALVRAQGWRMFDDRTAAMTMLGGDLLPPAITARQGKAWFDSAFYTDTARTFAAQWDGTGVDPEFVDLDELRRAWTTPGEAPDARTYLMLQSAWLAAQH